VRFGLSGGFWDVGRGLGYLQALRFRADSRMSSLVRDIGGAQDNRARVGMSGESWEVEVRDVGRGVGMSDASRGVS
jgi:hypothetical protein